MSEMASIEIAMDLSWRYASGAAMERFCAGLRERRIEALRCSGCGRRYLPPRPMCGRCRLRLTDWTAVANQGELMAWTVIYLPFLDARSGETRPGPYGMGLIRLDGADTTLNHYLAENDPGRLAIGQRVRAVWREELRGAMDDILHFEVAP
jgi:hypothetical protein